MLTRSQQMQLDVMFRKSAHIGLARACQWLCIDKDTFYRYNKFGVFEGIREQLAQLPGGHYRISRECLVAILDTITDRRTCLPKAPPREPESLPLPGIPAPKIK